MIRKVYEVDPMACPKCGSRMKVVAFLTEYAVVDRIIDPSEADVCRREPPPSHVFEQVAFRVYRGPCPCLPTVRFLSGKIIDLSVRLYMARFGALTVPAGAC